MTPAMRKAWNWLKNDMAYKPPEQLGTAEEVALHAFSCGWLKGHADGAVEQREKCAKVAEQFCKVPTCDEYKHCCRIDKACDGIAKDIRARGNE